VTTRQFSVHVISLVGLPGVGKSTVGKQLARGLGFKFFDADSEIEHRIGCSIREYFDREGEDPFRDIEETVIAELLAQPDAVLATGGGAVLRDTNRQALHKDSAVVYLRTKPDDLYYRMRHDTRRPLLQVRDPRRKLRELYAQRDPLYRETAHFVVETGRLSAARLVNTILMQLELAGVIDPSQAPSPVEPVRAPH